MGLSTDYRPRRVTDTPLYRIVAEHLGAFLEYADARDRSVPEFVRAELEGFLSCGILEHGFALAECGHCQFQRLVPFSCRGRGWCPSCMGRRMSDTAARLVDQVLPRAPIRQWVLSLPHALRFLLAYDVELCGEVLGLFTREIFDWLERTARHDAELSDEVGIYPGAVTAIQRADSAGKLNLHCHTLALDGVYVFDPSADSDELRFVATRPPTRAEVSAVAWAVCQRTMDSLKARGLAMDANLDDLDPQSAQGELLLDPMLAQCASASMQGVVLLGPRAGKQVLRLGRGPSDTDARGRAAHGFDLHAGRRVSAGDRAGLERLCRYILRPPLSHDRISITDTGQVKLRLKRPWGDGTTHLVMDPLDFLSRLVPLIPPPRTHRVRYHGILSSHHRLRARVAPRPPADDTPSQMHLWRNRDGKLAPAPKHRVEWHKLMARTLGVDPLRCPHCKRQMRIVGFITQPERIAWYLHWRGMGNRGPPPPYRARGPPQLELPFPASLAAA